MNIFISLSVIFWSLFPSLLSYTQNSPFPNKIHLQNIIDNGDFNQNITPWVNYYNASLTFEDNSMKVVKNQAANISRFRQPKVINVSSQDLYYFSLDIKTPNSFVYFTLSSFYSGGESSITSPNYYINPNTFATFSYLGSFTTNHTSTNLGFSVYVQSAINGFYYVDNLIAYNVSQMIANGVKDDNGVSFSSLTNIQIKAQIDTWVSQIPSGYNSTYYLTTAINDDYKWFSTGFVDKAGERDFLDYLGFFVWLAVPPISIYLIYKLMKGVIYE